MSKPQPTARLAVQTAAGTAYYRVADVELLADGAAVVTVIAGEWLDMGVHPATYTDGDVRTARSCVAYAVQSSIEKIRFVGIFTAAQGKGMLI